MAYICKYGGECVACGECSLKERKAVSVKCPVCGRNSTLIYIDSDDNAVGCEHCIFAESAFVYLNKDSKR